MLGLRRPSRFGPAAACGCCSCRWRCLCTSVARAQQHLLAFIGDLVIEGAKAGDLRNDIAPAQLATFCIHALTAANSLPSKAALRRLVTLVLAGLQPPR